MLTTYTRTIKHRTSSSIPRTYPCVVLIALFRGLKKQPRAILKPQSLPTFDSLYTTEAILEAASPMEEVKNSSMPLSTLFARMT